MILHISRVSALFALVGLGAYYLINTESFVYLGDKLAGELENERNSSLQLELDKNKSDALITALYKERSKMRQSIEDLEVSVEKLKKDFELTAPLMEKTKKEHELSDSAIKEVIELAKKSEVPLQSLKSDNESLFSRHENLSNERTESLEKLSELRKSADSLQGDLTALTKERETAESNFLTKKDDILSEIKHPGHLYFGDQVEVLVSSKAPSGQGIFIDLGSSSGLLGDMMFLANKKLSPDEIPLIFKSTVVEDEFSYLEFKQLGNSSETLSVEDGQKLFLIRTGDSNKTE